YKKTTKPKRAKKANNTITNPDDRIYSATIKLVRATWALVGVTFILFVVTYLIFKEATNQSQANKDIADRSDKRVVESLADAQKNFVVQNRPYIFIEEFTRNGLYPDNIGLATGIIRNGGKTPALNVRIFSKMEIYNSGDKCDFKIGEFGNSFSIAPNAPFKIESGRNITTTQSNAIMKHTKFLYFWGKITYEDSFGGTYFTSFCAVLKFNDFTDAKFDFHSCFNDVK
ncbi:MAG: hypothetical protein ACXVNN_08700, partial [Bacteroidia bacterium]